MYERVLEVRMNLRNLEIAEIENLRLNWKLEIYFTQRKILPNFLRWF